MLSRIIAVAKKNITQLLNQKSTLVMTFVAPIVTFFLFSLVFSSSTDPRLIIETVNAPAFLSQMLKDQNIYTLHENANKHDMISRIQSSSQSIGLIFKKDMPNVYVGGISFVQNQQNLKMLKEFFGIMKRQQTGIDVNSQRVMFKTHYVHKIENFSMFETMAPGMISVMIMFFVFVITGMAFLEEKSSGTLERVFITPLKIHELIIGYLIAFGLIALTQVGIFQAFYYYVFKIQINGSFFQATVVSIITALVALTLGMLVSSFAKTQFQVMQTIPIFMAPQMVLCGIFDISNTNVAVRFISKLLPMTHSVSALQKILLENKSIADTGKEISILLCFVAVSIIGTYIFLGRYKPKFFKK